MHAILIPHVPLSRSLYRPSIVRPRPQPGRGPERRTERRIPQPPLHVSGLDVAVEDVSLGGICIRSRQPLGVGDRFNLILTDGACFYTREMVGEVQWCRGGLSGLLWVDPTPGDREWLRARFAQWPGRRRLRLSQTSGAAAARVAPRVRLRLRAPAPRLRLRSARKA